MTPDEFEQYRNRVASEMDCIERHMHMNTDPTTVPAPQPSLRKAALEALCSAEAFLASSASVDEERFRKALEQLAEALAQ